MKRNIFTLGSFKNNGEDRELKNPQITKEESCDRRVLWGNYCLANSVGKSEKVAKRKLDGFEQRLFKRYKVNPKTHDIKWSTGWFYKKRNIEK